MHHISQKMKQQAGLEDSFTWETQQNIKKTYKRGNFDY
jgi:hypothetical protein